MRSGSERGRRRDVLYALFCVECVAFGFVYGDLWWHGTHFYFDPIATHQIFIERTPASYNVTLQVPLMGWMTAHVNSSLPISIPYGACYVLSANATLHPELEPGHRVRLSVVFEPVAQYHCR